MDHTILLRTRNRTEWIERYIINLNEFCYSGVLMIVDDSMSQNYETTSQYLDQIQTKLNYKVKHLRGPFYQHPSRTIRVFESTKFILNQLESKYCSFSSDDDFIFPYFISKGINFLENNSDFSTFIGPEVKIFYDVNLSAIKKSVKVWNGCDLDDPLERLSNYVSLPTLAYYGVCRSENFNNVINGTKIPDLFLRTHGSINSFDEEIPWVMLCYLAGKVYYERKLLQGIRGEHQSIDRAGGPRSKEIMGNGVVDNFVDYDSRILINETIAPLSFILTSQKSQANAFEIRRILINIFWQIVQRQNRNLITDNASKNSYKNIFRKKIKHAQVWIKFHLKYKSEIKLKNLNAVKIYIQNMESHDIKLRSHE